jgi:hypothetical protein
MALSLRRFRLRRSSPLDEAVADLVASAEASRIRSQASRTTVEEARVALAASERTRAVAERQRAFRVGLRAATERSLWYRAVKVKRHKPQPRARWSTVTRRPRRASVRRRPTATRGSPRSTDPPDEPHDVAARLGGFVRVVRRRL